MEEIHNLEELFKLLAKKGKLFKNCPKDYTFDNEYNRFMDEQEDKILLAFLNTSNELLIDNVIFFDGSYQKLLDKFNIIKFKSCIFENCFSYDLISTKNKKLSFEKCTIKGEFKHIFSESLIFKDSEIEKYYFNNLLEDKIEIKDLLFFNSKIDNLELEGVVLKKQLIKSKLNLTVHTVFEMSLLLMH